jgi:ketosteroid isomerase-like protein
MGDKRYWAHASACALLLLGCGGRAVTHRPVTAATTTSDVNRMARQALLLDATRDPVADSLYAPDAVVIANARIRLGQPRYAGVGYGGRVTVAAATVTLHGEFAWATLDYRWINAEQRQAEVGRATLVLARRPNGWKIIHAHSSQLLPWDR